MSIFWDIINFRYTLRFSARCRLQITYQIGKFDTFKTSLLQLILERNLAQCEFIYACKDYEIPQHLTWGLSLHHVHIMGWRLCNCFLSSPPRPFRVHSWLLITCILVVHSN